MSTLELIRSDFARWKADAGPVRALSQEGLWVTVVYRVRHRLNSEPLVPGAVALRALLYPLAKFLKLLTGASLNPQARIGPGLKVQHTSSLYLGGGMVMGEGCTVNHEVTVGPSGVRSMEYPVIGDRVTLFPGAKVLGGITIGDDAVVGASSLVVADVPAGAVVSGNPARVIRMAGEDE